MKIEQVTLHHITNKLKTPFQTSFGVIEERESILVEMQDSSGVIGWGECVAFSAPWYTEETIKTCWHVMEDFLIPALLTTQMSHPKEVLNHFAFVKRNNMAKSALEGAVWDIYAKRKNVSLAEAIGGTRRKVEAGAAVGIGTPDQMVDNISRLVSEGYKRIKIKIKPGMEKELLEPIRTRFPDLPLMVDANSAYTLNELDMLKELDQYGLLMIEQPLAADDLPGHASLQQTLKTPICLDESIASFSDAVLAIHMNSCRIVNIKSGRVGGLGEAIRIHDYCQQHNIPVWAGGMIETGVSRLQTIALASLANFTLPGDISSTSHYWAEDVASPEVVVANGFAVVPSSPGVGVDVKRDLLKKLTIKKQVIKL